MVPPESSIMALTNSAQRYGLGPQLLHWLVVLLLALQFLLAELADELPDGLEKLAMLSRHKSVGITILGFAALRVAWRLLDRPPPLPAAMPGWQRIAAHFSHWALYALLFAMPLTGWMMSSAANYPVSWFGLVQLPDLVGTSHDLHETLEEVHETLAGALLVLVAVHVLAALKHQFVDRDGLLSRMLPWGGSRD
jgi:cytochrome b561